MRAEFITLIIISHNVVKVEYCREPWKLKRILNRKTLSNRKSKIPKLLKWFQKISQKYKICDRSGIRTHASEDTAALTQRLRPLGHPALIGGSSKLLVFVVEDNIILECNVSD